MKLTTKQSYELLERFGCYVTEACDKCGKLLGPVRYTQKGDPEVWCSRECRGEAPRPDRNPGVLIRRKHAGLADRIAARRANGKARQVNLRLRKAALQSATIQ
jgi:hypothetical protein